MSRHLLRMPQFGANDEEATLLRWHLPPGAVVTIGEMVFEAETSKATFDVEAGFSGAVYPMVAPGERRKFASPVGVISEVQGETEDAARAWFESEVGTDPATKKPTLPYTKKALLLAKRYGLSIEKIEPQGDRITEADVEAFRKKREASD